MGVVMRTLAVVGSAMILSACVSMDEERVWQRLDGVRMTGNPTLEQEFYQARYACQLQQSANRPQAPPSIVQQQTVNIGGGGLPALQTFDIGPSIAAYEAGQQRADSEALFASCMNANGYLWGPRPAA